MKKKVITLIVFAAGISLIIAGVVLKQPAMVMAKAVRICMECIGLG